VRNPRRPKGPGKAILVLFLAFASASLRADDPSVLRFATVSNLPPYSFVEGGNLKGIDIEVAREIANRAGVAVEIETMPWARVLRSMETGQADGAFSMYYVKARESFLVYVGIMHYDSLGLLVNASAPVGFRGMETLTGLTVARGRGVFVSDSFEAAAAEGKIKVIDSDDTQMGNVRMLTAGRVDAVIGVVETMLYYADELGVSDRVMAESVPIDGNRPGYLALSKASPAATDPAFQKRLSAAIQSVMTDGTYRRILEKYKPGSP